SVGHVHLYSRRKRLDDRLFRKEVSLSAFSFPTVSPADQDLGRDAADWRTCGSRVSAVVCIYSGGLRDHPWLWTGGTGRLWNWRARDAGAVSTGGGAQFCCFARGGPELRRPARGSGPALRLFCNWNRIVDDAGAYL